MLCFIVTAHAHQPFFGDQPFHRVTKRVKLLPKFRSFFSGFYLLIIGKGNDHATLIKSCSFCDLKCQMIRFLAVLKMMHQKCKFLLIKCDIGDKHSINSSLHGRKELHLIEHLPWFSAMIQCGTLSMRYF